MIDSAGRYTSVCGYGSVALHLDLGKIVVDVLSGASTTLRSMCGVRIRTNHPQVLIQDRRSRSTERSLPTHIIKYILAPTHAYPCTWVLGPGSPGLGHIDERCNARSSDSACEA